ncbi:hypothetical protein A2957_02750 [Candidatus Roizmanbacteria bacterium RIFCSPLOWO2_01_FULL_38_11]|uniref:Oxidoreductase DRL-like catalytic domain-containing protein n=1 Tax=Candidatus Roizmanbacteria bacterium RIFCSPLOWO2_01_FULL_38_11 TaxID=1802060 RepID=A0A1F7IKU2_9BACT|nr:MAG: hypothetical protein A2957_02750 [Candidatus Roizmanbacteria bacterium RIFCSPLOWO2_01_FULL_38_11]
MYGYIYSSLSQRKDPIDIIIIGLGFMGFGFLSGIAHIPGLRIPLIISRRPQETVDFLIDKGFNAVVEDDSKKIKDNAQKGLISVSSNLDLISTYENKYVIEMTGTVNYGAQAALATLNSGKHLITMNPELQSTLGTQLKEIADTKKLNITDVYGDQPGSLARLMYHSKMMGFRPIVAGNMKRYRDNYATQEKMKKWAEDKGLAVRQTVSFTDGTKQAIEMTLVANYFGMDILRPGMKGIQVDNIRDTLDAFKDEAIPDEGIVDYAIGINLFPGVFVIAEHTSPHQQKYLKYLNMGDGPRYVLFDAYHLCHLEVANTIAQLELTGKESVNNGSKPTTSTIAYAKQDLNIGDVIDGIGGDMVRGDIVRFEDGKNSVPVGLSEGALVIKNISKDSPIDLQSVKLPNNTATKLWKGEHVETE